jgi:putative toxin-antitoxin system antitoxin component (TIGR02293 family)
MHPKEPDGIVPEKPLSLEEKMRLITKQESAILAIKHLRQILELASDVLGDWMDAEQWVVEPNPATDNKPPIELLGTEQGYQLVSNLLRRIQYGTLA